MDGEDLPSPSTPPAAPLPPPLPPIPLLETVDHNQLLALLRQPADINQAAWIEILDEPDKAGEERTFAAGSAEKSTDQESRSKEDEMAPLQDSQLDSSSDTTASNAGSCKQKPEKQRPEKQSVSTRRKNDASLSKKREEESKEKECHQQDREEGLQEEREVERPEKEEGEEGRSKVNKEGRKERGRKRFLWQQEEELQDPVQEAKRLRAIKARYHREKAVAREEKLRVWLKKAENEVARVSQERDQYKEMYAALLKKWRKKGKRERCQSKSQNVATTAKTSTI